MNWFLRTFDELSLRQLYQLLKLRQDVFVVEQNCPYLDADGEDEQAEHLFARSDDGQMIAYARLYQANDSQSYSRIGRVLTAQSVRRTGLGRELMQRAIDYLEQRGSNAPIRVGAQVYLLQFYKDFGFKPIGDEYLEDGIPHIDMER
ncbi:GNAT family N-acetyltransferase [Idiomarina sp.]|jgi:ElaA protein|uniref:GNAT family N-acetyltransferase n=1 Tax=Idiomarina sp. TaxID=1874361 RepID=UPI0025BFF5C7|nr:GNAT family N-acetyltransferase [Idiomarina sp.]